MSEPILRKDEQYPIDDARGPFSVLSEFEERLLAEGYCLADIQRMRDEVKNEAKGSIE